MRILILEDEKTIAKGIMRWLLDIYDNPNIYIVVDIDNIPEHLEFEYDLAIIDYNFGFWAWSQIKSEKKLLISGDNLGLCSYFLAKPFFKEDLIEILEKI